VPDETPALVRVMDLVQKQSRTPLHANDLLFGTRRAASQHENILRLKLQWSLPLAVPWYGKFGSPSPSWLS
jgi:hypothetical protein